MSQRIERALKTLNLWEKYEKKFKDEEVDDSIVEDWLEDAFQIQELAEIIPIAGHRSRFIKQFRSLGGQVPAGTASIPPAAVAMEVDSTVSSSSSNGGLPPLSFDTFTSLDAANWPPPSSEKVQDPKSNEVPNQEEETPTFVLPSDPQPIQVMDLVPDSASGNTKLKTVLYQDRLSAILNQSGNRPVSILSIAGPSRKGKSFMLGFMIRYLRSLETAGEDGGVGPAQDWIGRKRPDDPLTGFTWRNGFERETSGMWMWSRPFKMKSCDDREYSVILMDTQGVFDEHTSQREWSTIVGLSLLTSSCLIFNIFTDLQEESLQSLENFMSFGLLAVGDANDDDAPRPFQKLVFLIRDWNNPDEFAYGDKGGQKFLAKKLEIKPEHQEDHRRVRKQLRLCFDSIDCFLMPEPGETAKKLTYNGSLSGLQPKFANMVEKFISGLLNPDLFPIKTIGGNSVTARELLSYFQSYVDIFNGDEIPEPKSLFEITKLACNAAVLGKCAQLYSRELASSMRGASYLTQPKLNDLHVVAMEKAMKLFKEARKMGTRADVVETETQLEGKISLLFIQLKQTNEASRLKIAEEATSGALGLYKSLMSETMEGVALSEEDCFEEETISQFSKNAEKSALEQFFDVCCIDEDDGGEHAFVDDQEKLLEGIRAAETDIQNLNRIQRSKSQEILRTQVQALVVSYKEEMGPLTEDKFLSTSQLAQIQQTISQKIINDFRLQRSGFTLLEQFKSELETELEKEFQYFVKISKGHNDRILLKVDKQLLESVNSYREGMGSFKGIDEVKFRDQHDSQKEQVIQLFRSFVDKVMRGTDQFEVQVPDDEDGVEQDGLGQEDSVTRELVDKLSAEIESEHKALEGALHQRCQEVISSMSNVETAALKMYGDAMALFLTENKVPDDSAMEARYETEKANALQSLRDGVYLQAAKICQDGADRDEGQAEIGNSEEAKAKFKECEESLAESCDQKFEKMRDERKMAREGEEARARNELAPAQNLFRTAIKEIADEAKDLTELETRGSAARESSRQFIRDKVIKDGPLGALQETLLAELEVLLDSAYVEILDYFKLKQDEDKVMVKGALDTASRFYNEQMETHMKSAHFIQPDRLKKLHKETATAAVAHSKAQQTKVQLTTSQERQLRESMDLVFRKFEDENYMRLPQDSPAIGIDLGTTYSCAAVYHQGKVLIIPNEQSNHTTPSYVAFHPSGSISAGETAKNQAHVNPKHTIFDAKRLIGRQFDDPVVQRDIKLWPFEVVKEVGIPKIRAQGKLYHPEEISAKILAYLKTCAEKFLNLPVKDVVITVPAYFTDGQRQATKDAGRIAGLNVLKIINEPTAAAIAYKLHRSDDLQRNVLIFDLGGGTFDVAVVTMRAGELDVKAVGGDTHLGGEDFDHEMVQFCLQQFGDFTAGQHSKNEVERALVSKNLRRIRSECERQKRILSGAEETTIEVDNASPGKDLSVPMTRSAFEVLNQASFDKCIVIVDTVLNDAKLTKGDIDDIVLIGGSTRIPKVQEMLRNSFNDKALNISINPDEAVAVGAAIQACLLKCRGEDGQLDQGLRDKFQSISDVTPLSIGVEVVDKSLSVVVPKNTKVPCSKIKRYGTVTDNQTGFTITIYEGEIVSTAVDNNLLGKVELKGIPMAPRGVQEVDVSMSIDKDGILKVTATSVNTRSTANITISTQKGRLNDKELEELEKNTSKYAASQSSSADTDDDD